ncbi:DmX-like protein 1 [Homalodisca vitripennis]|nr:DmX-like protein 1 [Homalodisca vitripennis]
MAAELSMTVVWPYVLAIRVARTNYGKTKAGCLQPWCDQVKVAQIQVTHQCLLCPFLLSHMSQPEMNPPYRPRPVCLNKLEDLQLAMVITRLYEGDMDSTPPSLKRLLYEEVLGCDAKGENQSQQQAHPDPFLRSMALWILKEYTGSLNTLLQTNVGNMHPLYQDDKQEGSTANPNVFNFYVYLRTHPLVIRQYLAASYQDKKKHTVVLSGFSYGMENSTKQQTSDRQSRAGTIDVREYEAKCRASSGRHECFPLTESDTDASSHT